MKQLYILLILFSLISGITASTCDSVVVIYSSERFDNSPITADGIEVDSFQNGLLMSITTNQSHRKFLYDSLDRLKTEFSILDSTVYSYNPASFLNVKENYYWNGSVWINNLQQNYFYYLSGKDSAIFSNVWNGTAWINDSLVNYFYSSSGKDSLIIKSKWNGTSFSAYREFNFYFDANDSLIRIENHIYDTTQWVIDTLTIVAYPAGLNNNSRIDSIFKGPNISMFPVIITYYDTAIRVIVINQMFGMFVGFTESFQYYCNQLSSYWNNCSGCHSGNQMGMTFDSLCRPVTKFHGFYQMTGGNTTYLDHWYYVDCNSMILIPSEDLKICSGDSVTLGINYFGGTGPYHIQWAPTQGLVSDTLATTKASPLSSITYTVTVTDANAISSTATINVQVTQRPVSNLRIESIDTISTCQSAILVADSFPGASYGWLRDSIFIPNYSTHLPINYNGTYILYTNSGSCPGQQDTLVFSNFTHPSPAVHPIVGCSELYVVTIPQSRVQWFENNVLIPGSISDTLSVDHSGYYQVVATDSSGCQSGLVGINYNLFSVSPTATHTCIDSCHGLISVQPNYNFSFLWSNGDTTSYSDSLCAGIYSVTVTNNHGCTFTSQDTIFNFLQQSYNYMTAGATSSLSCDGFVIPVDTAGSPYSASYQWEDHTNDFLKDSLCAGWHYVLMTPSNTHCPQVDSFFIASSPSTDACTLLFNTHDIGCNGLCNGSFSVNSSSGSPFACYWLTQQPLIYYSFNKNQPYRCQGNYTCMIIDQHGCVDTESVTLTEPLALNFSYSTYESHCDDTCVTTLNVTGGTLPYTYHWCDLSTLSQFKNCRDTCRFTIVDAHGCQLNDTTYQQHVSPLNLSMTSLPASCKECSDGLIIFHASGGNLPYTYSSDPSGQISGDTVKYLFPGSYIACVMGTDSCSLCKQVNVSNPPDSIIYYSETIIFPNPFRETAIFKFLDFNGSGSTKLLITDLLGKQVRELKIISDTYEFKRDGLPSGMYIYSVEKNNTIVGRGKMVVQR